MGQIEGGEERSAGIGNNNNERVRRAGIAVCGWWLGEIAAGS